MLLIDAIRQIKKLKLECPIVKKQVSTMPYPSSSKKIFYFSDLLSGLVVFLIALPLCLGIALASGAPLISGIISGVIGGIVVGYLSRSHISVSGPAAGLTAIILTQLDKLNGEYEAFLLMILFAGVIQIVFGLLKFGSLSYLVPNNVILGLLAAIGLTLVINQIPILIGLESQLFEKGIDVLNPGYLWSLLDDGAGLIGICSVLLILLWDKSRLKRTHIPSALVAIILAGLLNFVLIQLKSPLAVLQTVHLIQLPNVFSAESTVFRFPDFSHWDNRVIYMGAVTLAVVASLETLLNLEASDKVDPQKRTSPSNHELLAQGVGNSFSGLIGGLPITSVIVRSSVNASSGAKTKFSTIFHGVLLCVAILVMAPLFNVVPLSSLAAILILTGFKLASPQLFARLYRQGWKQFFPFIVTVIAILALDLLSGIFIGLLLSAGIVLHSHFQRGIRIHHETHLHGELIRIELAANVSFLNRGALLRALDRLKSQSTASIDASNVDEIDLDLLQVIRDFIETKAKDRSISIKLIGFAKNGIDLPQQRTVDVDIATQELQKQLSPKQVLDILIEGNQRFVNHQHLQHDIARQIQVTSQVGQHPIAAVLGCMDSRAPTERIFDVGIGDLFSLRIAGNVAGQKVLGSLEFACRIKGAKLIVVLGHTDCGAVTSACHYDEQKLDICTSKEAPHAQYFLQPIMSAIEMVRQDMSAYRLTSNFVQAVTEVNVKNNMAYILKNSQVLREMVEADQLGIVGAIYDVHTGKVTFI